MPKRDHSQVSSGGDGVSKRRAIAPDTDDEEALSILQVHADVLIQCLRDLKSGAGASSIPKLQEISCRILPAIHHLAQSQKPPSREAPTAAQQASEGSETPGHSSSPPIPSHFLLSPFKLEDIPDELPPLPPIKDAALETAVFTHAGVAGKSSGNYDRLEWLGDAYSEVISSSLLYSTFGSLEAGKLSQLRELLIKNATLGALAEKYGLVERANIPPDVKASKDRMKKVPGDLMEAYTAAVILDDPAQGLQRVGEWLRAVFGMTIKEQIKAHERTQKQAPPAIEGSGLTAKDRLRSLIVVPGVKLRYEDDPSGPKFDKHHKKLPVFSVNLYLDGWGEKNKMLGRGTDLNKKQAGQKAAQMALDSTKLIQKLNQKKKAYLAAQEEQ